MYAFVCVCYGEQYGDAMAADNLVAGRGVAHETLAPGYFVPVSVMEGDYAVSDDGREHVPNPFPIVPQARIARRPALVLTHE